MNKRFICSHIKITTSSLNILWRLPEGEHFFGPLPIGVSKAHEQEAETTHPEEYIKEGKLILLYLPEIEG